MLSISQIAVRPQNSQRNGQVEACAFFADVGRRQVNRRLVKRKKEGAVINGGTNSFARLANGRIRETNDGYRRWIVRLASRGREVDLDIDQISVNPVNSGR